MRSASGNKLSMPVLLQLTVVRYDMDLSGERSLISGFPDTSMAVTLAT